MNPEVELELFRQTIEAIRECIDESMTCKHPPGDGSDDPCDGEDCIRCYVMGLANSALGSAKEAAPEVKP